MKLSVAMCTYNGAIFLEEQLNSILNQTQKIDEIIVCDDRSNDATIEILEKYQTNFPGIFKIYINETNLKSVKNFEKAITLCSGDIIFLSDQDDRWATTKVENYIHFFNENPAIKLVVSNGFCINENSEVLEKYSFWDVPSFLKEQNIPFDYFKLITYFSNIFTGATMAFRANLIPDIIPFPIIEDLHHDEWIAIIAASKNELGMLNENYLYYRIHSNQQVGGVFFDKTPKQKQHLTKHFNIHENNISFGLLKRKLKKLNLAYHKNLKFIGQHPKHDNLFRNNASEIKTLFFETKKSTKEKYPISFFLLSIIDKIKNKRQFTES